MEKKLISSITPNSLINWPKASIVVVAHDAGAAKHIFNWTEKLTDQIVFCTGGPALKLLKEQRPNSTNNTTLKFPVSRQKVS